MSSEKTNFLSPRTAVVFRSDPTVGLDTLSSKHVSHYSMSADIFEQTYCSHVTTAYSIISTVYVYSILSMKLISEIQSEKFITTMIPSYGQQPVYIICVAIFRMWFLIQ